MATSTLTDKGQTTVPQAVREALGVKSRQQLEWTIRNDGTVLVRSQPSALELFGSLPVRKRTKGPEAERAAMMKAVAKRAAKEGI